jgi:hypothetical protein
MRGLRSTIALAVVLGGLAAYIYFVTWRRPAVDEPTNPKVFASIEADKIDELSVSSASGDTTTLKKTDAGWEIVSPIAGEADATEVTNITDSLASAELMRVADENPADLKDYGLDVPRLDVGFKVAGNPNARHLLVGEKSPTGDSLFARRDSEKQVFLIRASLESTLNRSSFDLRDKTLLTFDRIRVDGIELVVGGQTIRIAKEGTEWKLTAPLAARTDGTAVAGLLDRLQSAKMASVVSADASPADLTKYGLDRPEVTATLLTGSDKATLLLGAKSEDKGVYARDGSRPIVMTVEDLLANDLKKGLDAYRAHYVFEFRPLGATHVEITRGDQTVVFDKAKGTGQQGADTWRRVSPNPGNLSQDSIDPFLTNLASLRVASFVGTTTNTGLNQPVATVAVKFDDGKREERVTFGKSAAGVFGARPSEPDSAKLDDAAFDEVMKGLDGLLK